jgi:hypothetical protein
VPFGNNGRNFPASVGGAGGRFCGEIETPKEYTSDNDEVWIVFHVEKYDEQNYFLFESRAERRRDFAMR